MNLQRARYLVAVAEHSSFTRAAAALHVAQSALSQQIKVLEREVGVTLIDRNGPRIGLTDAGVVAVREARFLLVAADRALMRIQAAASGSATLRFAHTRSWAGGAIANTLDAFRTRFPDVAIEEHRGFTKRNLELVREGVVDIAVVRPPVDEPDMTVEVMDREQLLLAVPANHPFTTLDRIRPEQLVDEPVVFWPRSNGPGMYDCIVEQMWPDTAPRVVRSEADDEQVLHAVGAGVGIAPIPAGRANTFRVPGVHLCQLDGPPKYLTVGIAYRPDNPNAALRDYLDLI
ncbi:LysR family transcriptional regulator [Nocardia fusca]|uniref:LysR family transcriptional regulator n=1 Tax=Nocardia fusca TaxID=941183 RepID=UPI0037A89469